MSVLPRLRPIVASLLFICAMPGIAALAAVLGFVAADAALRTGAGSRPGVAMLLWHSLVHEPLEPARDGAGAPLSSIVPRASSTTKES